MTLNVDRCVFQHGLTRVQIIAGNLYAVVSLLYLVSIVIVYEFTMSVNYFNIQGSPTLQNVFCNFFGTLNH